MYRGTEFDDWVRGGLWSHCPELSTRTETRIEGLRVGYYRSPSSGLTDFFLSFRDIQDRGRAEESEKTLRGGRRGRCATCVVRETDLPRSVGKTEKGAPTSRSNQHRKRSFGKTLRRVWRKCRVYWGVVLRSDVAELPSLTRVGVKIGLLVGSRS